MSEHADYSALAVELLEKMHDLHSAKQQKDIDEALRGEAVALHYLAHHNGKVSPGQIVSEMKVSSARIAQTLNSVEKKGWITREIDPSDRRKVLVALTPTGEDAAAEHLQRITDLTTKMLALLGEKDAKEYVRITGKLAERVKEESMCCN